MLTKNYTIKVQWMRWSLNALITIMQVYLIHKYMMAWYDWLIWGVLLVCGYTVTRISSVTEGIVQTILREEMYNKVKRMLFDDDERNTPDRMMK